MNLKEFLATVDVDAFAARCGTSRFQLRNVAYAQRSCGIKLAVVIERESERKVTRQELRPADWLEIWPELLGF